MVGSVRSSQVLSVPVAEYAFSPTHATRRVLQVFFTGLICEYTHCNPHAAARRRRTGNDSHGCCWMIPGPARGSQVVTSQRPVTALPSLPYSEARRSCNGSTKEGMGSSCQPRLKHRRLARAPRPPVRCSRQGFRSVAKRII